jgi:hypothetical protein
MLYTCFSSNSLLLMYVRSAFSFHILWNFHVSNTHNATIYSNSKIHYGQTLDHQISWEGWGEKRL